jgi:hypothetical protein
MTITDTQDIWSAIAAPLPSTAVNWRQDGKPTGQGGKFSARFVAFVDAQFVRERLDIVVPGEWGLTLEMLPNRVTFDGEEEKEPYAFKARLQVLGVFRESVGQGKDYKTAETDAFKRAAVRFGIAAELYSYGPNYVPMDGDGRYAKPLEDPAVSFARRHGGTSGATGAGVAPQARTAPEARQQPAPASPSRAGDSISDGSGDPPVVGDQPCPKCGGRTWDNRLTKRNPKAPDWKCRDRNCDGVIWPPKEEKFSASARANGVQLVDGGYDDVPPLDDDDMPPY